MSKALILIICALVGAVLFMVASYVNIKAKLTAAQYELASLTLALDSQNAHIKALERDAKTYKEAKPKIEQKIITKYVKIKEPISSCESRILHIQNLVRAWYGVELSENER